MRTLAERIQSLRLPGETQAQFAERLNTTQASISRYLNGRQPDRETLIKIARQTGVSLDWLLTGNGSGPSAGADSELKDADRVRIITDQVRELEGLDNGDRDNLARVLRLAIEDENVRRRVFDVCADARERIVS